METRLKKFNLEVAPEKTQLFEFGHFAQSKAKARGERPATFDFLGFTHYNSRSRDGKCYRMKRKTGLLHMGKVCETSQAVSITEPTNYGEFIICFKVKSVVEEPCA